jgi:hypothetical protein
MWIISAIYPQIIYFNNSYVACDNCGFSIVVTKEPYTSIFKHEFFHPRNRSSVLRRGLSNHSQNYSALQNGTPKYGSPLWKPQVSTDLFFSHDLVFQSVPMKLVILISYATLFLHIFTQINFVPHQIFPLRPLFL